MTKLSSVQFLGGGFRPQVPEVAPAVGIIGTTVAASTLVQIQIGAKTGRVQEALHGPGWGGEFLGIFHDNICNAPGAARLGMDCP